MLQQLVTVLPVSLGAGASTTVPHGLHDGQGNGLAPNFVIPNEGTDVAVTAVTPTTITFENGGSSTETPTFHVEHRHSIIQGDQPAFLWQGISGGGGGAGSFVEIIPSGIQIVDNKRVNVAMRDPVTGNIGDLFILPTVVELAAFTVDNTAAAFLAGQNTTNNDVGQFEATPLGCFTQATTGLGAGKLWDVETAFFGIQNLPSSEFYFAGGDDGVQQIMWDSGSTQLTVGAAGGAAPLPGPPAGYIKIKVGTAGAHTDFVIPFYAA